MDWRKTFILVASLLSAGILVPTWRTPYLLESMDYVAVFGTMASFVGAIFAAWATWSTNKQLEGLEHRSDENSRLIALGNQKREGERRAGGYLRLHHGVTLTIVRTETRLGDDRMAHTPVSEDHCFGVIRAAVQRLDGYVDTMDRSCTVAVKGPRVYLTFEDLLKRDHAGLESEQLLTQGFYPVVKTAEGRIRYAEGDERGPRFATAQDSEVDGTRTVHAIVGRFTGSEGRGTCFVVAGASQWGTLAAGFFLERLLDDVADRVQDDLGIPLKRYEAFFGAEDFVFLITGTFLGDSLRPERIDSFATWVRDGSNTWRKQGGR